MDDNTSIIILINFSSLKVKYKTLDSAFRKHMSTLSATDKPGPGNEIELLKFFSLFLAYFFECLHYYNACLDPQSPSKPGGQYSFDSILLVDEMK